MLLYKFVEDEAEDVRLQVIPENYERIGLQEKNGNDVAERSVSDSGNTHCL